MWPSSRAGVCLIYNLLPLNIVFPYCLLCNIFSYRFVGRPGDYVYVFGDYRMEEVCSLTHITNDTYVCTVNVYLCLEQMCVVFLQCAPPGCLIELCIQLSMIMLGKQLIQNNVFEVLIP